MKGNALNQEHYMKAAMQPIEVAQRLLTKEEFIGAMKFSIIKYSMRAGKKGNEYDSDMDKKLQYSYWKELAESDITISPSIHSLPINYKFKGL